MGLEFNEEPNFGIREPARLNKPTGLTGFMITRGLAKNTRQASLIQVGIIVFLLLVIAFFGFGGGGADRERLIDNTDPLTGEPMVIPQ